LRPRGLLTGGAAFAIASFTIGVAVTLGGGCSLGLDESLLNSPGDGAVSPPGDAPSGDDGNTPPRPDSPITQPEAGPCSVDTDCKAPNGCFTGHCDPALHACRFDVCPQTDPCKASTCTVSTGTCGAPATVKFHATSFAVALGAVGCGDAPQRCLAAAWPFVFVGTVNGVVAYSVADPTSTAPAPIPVSALPFPPSQMIASGSRVWLAGSSFGSTPNAKVQLAWIDVPSNPQSTSITANTVLQVDDEPPLLGISPAPNGGVYVISGDASKYYPISLVNAPLGDLASIKSFANSGVDASVSTPLASSGTRMVFGHFYDYDNFMYLTLMSGVGTASSTPSTEKSLASSFGTMYPQYSLGSSPEGTVVFTAPSTIPDPDGGQRLLNTARLAWLLDNQADTTLKAAPMVDVETYTPPIEWNSALIIGPVAVVDPNTVVVVAADPANLGGTVVQVVTRAPGGLDAGVVAGRRQTLAASYNRIGVTVSHGFAYALTSDPPDGGVSETATVHVFAPSCAP
jgi:hypothetical protein